MLRSGRLLPVAVLCLAALGCADAQSRSTGTGPVTVRSSLDRTAAWVGDPLTYTLEVVCSPGYDIVEGDLARDRLPLEGLDVRAASTTREGRDDGAVVYRGRVERARDTPAKARRRNGPLSVRD